MHYLPFGGPKQFSESAYQCLISYLFAIPSYLPLQRERFSRAKDQGRERIIGLWESSTQLFLRCVGIAPNDDLGDAYLLWI